jgi:hypothetical protein
MKSGRDILNSIMNKSKKFSKKLNKTVKKCNRFCEKHLIEMNNKLKEGSKKYNFSYKPPTKEEKEFAYNTCKKSFCNVNCDGYDFFGDKQKQIEFKKKIKNSFQKGYSKEKVKMLKKRGALSGCVEIVDI